MSAWRREASKRLPEYQRIIASPDVDSPMMLWIELSHPFELACADEPLPLELLKRFIGYADWCVDEGHEDVSTAAIVAFFEHLLDSEDRIRALPKLMSRERFLELREVLLYHNEESEFRRILYNWGKD